MKLDLMSGPNSIYGRGWVSYDKQVAIGVRDLVEEIDKYFLPGSISKVEVNNPQSDFLEEIYKVLAKGCKITIRGNFSNKFFNKLWKPIIKGETALFKYNVINTSDSPDKIALDNNFFWTDNETPIKSDTLLKIILEK